MGVVGAAGSAGGAGVKYKEGLRSLIGGREEELYEDLPSQVWPRFPFLEIH